MSLTNVAGVLIQKGNVDTEDITERKDDVKRQDSHMAEVMHPKPRNASDCW